MDAPPAQRSMMLWLCGKRTDLCSGTTWRERCYSSIVFPSTDFTMAQTSRKAQSGIKGGNGK